MDVINTPVMEPSAAEKLKDHLDKKGTRYSWLTDKLDLSPAWLTRVLKGDRPLTEKRKKQIEEILDIQL